jgi:hypothetical protein
VFQAVDLSSLDASEEDKIQAMMTQSTQDYNPVKYVIMLQLICYEVLCRVPIPGRSQ